MNTSISGDRAILVNLLVKQLVEFFKICSHNTMYDDVK
jgi:hypothetical protein